MTVGKDGTACFFIGVVSGNRRNCFRTAHNLPCELRQPACAQFVQSDDTMAEGVRQYCRQLTAGIFNLLKNLGMWSGNVEAVRTPIVSGERTVEFINSGADGIFVSCVGHLQELCADGRRGQKRGFAVRNHRPA